MGCIGSGPIYNLYTIYTQFIHNFNQVRHLGLQLTFNLDWKEQASIMCLKASRKLSVLRIVKNLQISTLDILYKTTLRSINNFG